MRPDRESFLNLNFETRKIERTVTDLPVNIHLFRIFDEKADVLKILLGTFLLKLISCRQREENILPARPLYASLNALS